MRLGRAQPAPPFLGRRIAAPAAVGTLTPPVAWKNNNLHPADASDIIAYVINAAGTSIVTKTGLSMTAGVSPPFSDVLIVTGTAYTGFMFSPSTGFKGWFTQVAT